jgi:hypothetical protein
LDGILNQKGAGLLCPETAAALPPNILFQIPEEAVMRYRANAVLAATFFCVSVPSFAQQAYVVKPVAEKKLKELPSGPLYWRVENLETFQQAQAFTGSAWNADRVRQEEIPALAAEVAGKVWLFTLGPKGGSTPGAARVVEIGPLPPITAPEYLLRINHGSGPPGARTPVHTHPGSEAFYVVTGRLGQRTPTGTSHVEEGGSMSGHSAHTTMEVFNSGTTELTALIMFVVDATKPFSVPAKFE